MSVGVSCFALWFRAQLCGMVVGLFGATLFYAQLVMPSLWLCSEPSVVFLFALCSRLSMPVSPGSPTPGWRSMRRWGKEMGRHTGQELGDYEEFNPNGDAL